MKPTLVILLSALSTTAFNAFAQGIDVGMNGTKMEAGSVKLSNDGRFVRNIAHVTILADSDEYDSMLQFDVTDPLTKSVQQITVGLDERALEGDTICYGIHSLVSLDGDSLDDLDDCAIQFLDVNFDGVRDLCVTKGSDPRFGSYYEYWLFDPPTGLFAYNSDFDQVRGYNPLFNSSKKEIEVVAWGAVYRRASTFQLMNGKLTLVEEMNTESVWKNNKLYEHTVVQKLVNGELRVVKDTTTNPE
jgi:hypothetical protein